MKKRPSVHSASLRRFVAGLTFAMLASSALAEVKVEISKRNLLQVTWDGQQVVLPTKPEVRSIGGGKRTVFNPVTRQYDEIEMTAAQGVYLVVYNKKRQQVFLGTPQRTAEMKDGVAVFREEFPQADTWWEARFEPVGDNGLDIVLHVETSPNYWLSNFAVHMLDLNLDHPKGDSGDIRSRYRQRNAHTGDIPVPVNEVIRINYPDGPSMFVPAAVLQDEKLAMGVCLLGAHEVWRPFYGELELRPSKDGKAYSATIQSGWAHINSFENFYHQRFTKRYRLRFSQPKAVGESGFLRLVDAKDLWQDYMNELDQQVPLAPVPPYDKSKNNIVITNFMMAAPEYITPENPQGYVLNAPKWKEDKYEWPRPITPEMTDEQIKAITGGIGPEHVGRPVRWMKAWAEKNVRELQETNALATIIFRTSFDEGRDQSGKGYQNDYVPDTQLFHPDMEERAPVDGPVRDWDWVKANIRVEDSKGNLILEKKDVAIHAADKGRMTHIARHLDSRQVLGFLKDDIRESGQPYVEKAANLGPGDRLRDGTVLFLTLPYPAAQLVGLKPGDTAKLAAIAQVNDETLAKEALQVVAEITGVERAAIDIWAKTMTDAGQEFGFLVREDFYVGTAWTHTFRTFDWAADWQYQLLRQRIEWNRIRFGEKCRWFYLDVFADYTPQFVLEMLRNDFPDCFFFVEHPQDVSARLMQGWNWFGALTPLEQYVAPNALVGILPDRLLTGNATQDRGILKNFWKNPHYVLLTHRGAGQLLKLVEEK